DRQGEAPPAGTHSAPLTPRDLTNNGPRPEILASRALPNRYYRYRETAHRPRSAETTSPTPQGPETMPLTRLLPLTALTVLSGCVYGVRERTDGVQCARAMKPYALAPPGQAGPAKSADTLEKLPPPKVVPPGDGQGAAPAAPTDVQTAAFL